MSDSKSASELSSMDDLPAGWVQQYDPKTDHPFWVDTKATPPRAIWVHPYEDAQFLSEHPGIRNRSNSPHTDEAERPQKASKASTPDEPPPPYTPRRHSFSGSSSHSRRRLDPHTAASQPVTPASSHKGKEKDKQRGFFGKMKDKAIGTKEEREEARRRELIAAQRYAEQRRQQRAYYDDYYGAGSSRYGGSPYGSSSMGPPPFGPVMYNPPAGNPYVYGRPGYNGGYYPENRSRYSRGGGFGSGGIGLPLLGGLAGGLLLGDLLSGGF